MSLHRFPSFLLSARTKSVLDLFFFFFFVGPVSVGPAGGVTARRGGEQR